MIIEQTTPLTCSSTSHAALKGAERSNVKSLGLLLFCESLRNFKNNNRSTRGFFVGIVAIMRAC